MAYSEDVNVNLNVLAGTMGGITAIMGGMSALTSSFGAIGTEAANSFGTLDSLLVTATAMITAFGVEAAGAAGEFEQGMKIVQTVSGQTGSAIHELTDQANQMSVAYRTSIGDITDGLQTLGRAGLNSVNEQVEVLESGLQTAKLEGRSLNGVLEELIQNTAMLGGDLKSTNFGEQTEYLNTLMVGTSMTAPIDSHDISQTLQYAGGTAAAAGANLENKDKLEDLMGTVAAFAQKGVKGSMAGTALRAFFTKPASQDDSVVDALGSLGLAPEDLWEDGGESMKSVSDQIGLIQRRMEALKLSTMDQVELWGKIVGPKMGQQMMKLDSASIKELTRDIQSAKSAEDLAAQTLQTYTQKINELQQRGDVAFRELGAKFLLFLNPALDGLNAIMGVLSNPIINTVAFGAVGSILYHGFRRAWGMITTVFEQIRILVNEAISGMTTMNSLSGGSANGFRNTTSQVDMLNARLAETNTELAMMQAQFMKIQTVTNTGTYIGPLGLVNSKEQMPRNMISTAPQNVFVGNGMGKGNNYIGMGKEGHYYDPSEINGLKDEYRKALENENARHQAAIDKAYGTRVSTDKNGTTRYRDASGRFMSKDAFEKEMQGHKSQILTGKEIDKAVAKSVETGSQQIHSSMVSMTEAEYKRWMNGLRTSDDPLKRFNYKRQLELEKHAGSRISNVEGGQKFYRAVQFAPMQKRFNEYERLLQKEAQFKQFEQARARNIQQQNALARGKTGGFWNKQKDTVSGAFNRAQAFTTKRLQQYSNALGRANMAIRRTFGTLDAQSKTAQLKVNSAITAVEAELKEGGMTFQEALIRLSEETGYNAAELHNLLTATTELNIGFTTLEERLLALNMTTAEGEVAQSMHTKAILTDIAATEEGALAKAAGALTGGLQSVVGFMGGPFMAGMMGVMLGIQLVQQNMQAWQERIQEAKNELSEASDSLSEQEESIKELYSSENSNMTDADLDKAIDTQYASAYDAFYTGEHDRKALGQAEYTSDVNLAGKKDEETDEYKSLTADEISEKNSAAEQITLAKDENVKALNENTMQLLAATNAYTQAQEKLAKEFNDASWGFDGFASDATDKLGEWQESIWNVGAWSNGYDAREGFLDSNSPVLTGSQADSNYEGSTEFAGIFAADTFRFQNENESDPSLRYAEGLKQFFGSDYDRIIGLMSSMDGKMSKKYGENVSGRDALYTHASNFGGMNSKEMAIAQMSLKDNKEDYQKLGKQMFRYEQSTDFKKGRTAYQDYPNISKAIDAESKGDKRAYRKAMKNLGRGANGKLTVQDKNLNTTIKKLMALTDNKLSYQNILAMGQLQQLQDMQQVAQEQVAPGILQTVDGVFQNVTATGQASSNASDAAGGAISAANNAAAIASVIGAQAQDAAEQKAFKKYQRLGGTKSEQEFLAGLGDLSNHDFDSYRSIVFKTLGGSGWSVNNPKDATPENIEKNAARLEKALMENPNVKSGKASYQDMLDTITSPLVNYAQSAVMAAYDQSQTGEYGKGQRGSGSGSGSGSGDGSGSDKNNTGSTTNRVDLVLCNRKTIPKLNVNLFKKPPNFTIKNKQFNIRDIKINTEDKPDAMVDAVKDGIIRTQKRMDPKIIQDESAVYDPMAATDGTTPKGKTPVGTTTR